MAGEASDIRKIVERIERFTATRAQHDGQSSAGAPLDLGLDQVVVGPEGTADAFSFETDEKGRFSYVDGAPRAAVVGLTIGAPRSTASVAQTARRWARFGAGRRSATRASRSVPACWPGHGGFPQSRASIKPAACSAAIPARRGANSPMSGSCAPAPRIAAAAMAPTISGVAMAPGMMDWSGLSAAGARQLIHELRTPLSAIYAYAEMIEGQLVGPVSSEYRDMAAQIIADARQLVATFDDLDLAGQIARDEDRSTPGLVDLVAQLRTIVQRFAQSGSHRITLEAGGDLPSISGDREQTDRDADSSCPGGAMPRSRMTNLWWFSCASCL